MNKEQENQFKEHIKEMAKEEIQRTFVDNLMETLNSVFIFKYVETLELKCKKQKEIINKAIEILGNYKHYSTPDEKQNGDNEDLVNNVFNILKEVK